MVRRRVGKRSLIPKFCATLFWFLTCFNGLYAVKVVKIVVPEIVQFGVQDEVILDCDYTLSNATGLVIKWYFPTRWALIYQWIPPYEPQTLGIFKNNVDLSYKASNDPFKMHRAMRILKPTTDMTGNYTCLISTFFTEDLKTRHMTVFVPETNFRLIQNKTDDDTVNIICAAEGAFPAPNLTLATPEKLLDGVTKDVKLVNGRYSAVASVTLRDEDLPSPAEFICTLRIPLAKYVVRKEAIYYPGPISTTPEMPTAPDMQQAAAVSYKEANFYTAIAIVTFPVLAQMLVL